MQERLAGIADSGAYLFISRSIRGKYLKIPAIFPAIAVAQAEAVQYSNQFLFIIEKFALFRYQMTRS